MATEPLGAELNREDGGMASPLSDVDIRRAAFGAVGIAAFLMLWWVSSLFQPAYVLPSPTAVAGTFYGEAASGEMATALSQSALHWVPGAVVGTVLGIGTGVAFGWSRSLDDVLARQQRPRCVVVR